MENQEATTKKTADMKLYMREYMKKYYNKDPEKARAYRNTCRLRQLGSVKRDDAEKYGVHLANIVKAKNTLEKIPMEFVQEIFDQYMGSHTMNHE